jgi:hypothetical protein
MNELLLVLLLSLLVALAPVPVLPLAEPAPPALAPPLLEVAMLR